MPLSWAKMSAKDAKRETFFLFLKGKKDAFFEPANFFGMFVEIR